MINLMLNYLCRPAGIFPMLLFKALVKVIYLNLLISFAWTDTFQ